MEQKKSDQDFEFHTWKNDVWRIDIVTLQPYE